MNMFCYQCQEAAKGTGCTARGVCGKSAEVANLQDLLIYTLKGLSILGLKADELNMNITKVDKFLIDGLFMTITNTNFNEDRFIGKIRKGLKLREELKSDLINRGVSLDNLHDSAILQATMAMHGGNRGKNSKNSMGQFCSPLTA